MNTGPVRDVPGNLTIEQWAALTAFGYTRWTAQRSRQHSDLLRSMTREDKHNLLLCLAAVAPDLFDYCAWREAATRPGQATE